ncbi:ubiquitin-like domain-containing protein [Actinomycetota bacterium]
MFSPLTRRLAIAAAALTVVGGGAGASVYDKAVAVSVDGQTRQIHAFGSSVGDVLKSEGIAVGDHDAVVPSVDSSVSDGDKIVVRYGRKLTLTVDGQRQEHWTTATTLQDALAQLGVRESDGAVLSASRSAALGRDGLAVTMTTPKSVSLVADGKTRKLESTKATVGDLLTEAKVTLGKTDKVSPAAGTALKDGLAVKVQRITQRQEKKTEQIPFTTTEKRVSSRYVGDSAVVQQGREGVRTLTFTLTVTDGKVTARNATGNTVTTKPVTKVVEVGTKAKPAPKPTASSTTRSSSSSSSSSSAPRSSSSSSSSSAPKATSTPRQTASSSSGGGSINLANAAMWDRIAQCESTGNWSINTGNGYYGGLQFDIRTWLGAGGGDFAPRADLASRAQQITVANRVYAQRGLQPWGCAHAA